MDTNDEWFFAQVMVNDEKRDEVRKKIREFLIKYIRDEGFQLDVSLGNLPIGVSIRRLRLNRVCRGFQRHLNF